MPLSSAERSRRHRECIKNDPERLEEKRKKDRETWHQRVACGKVKFIESITESQQRSRRHLWRVAQQGLRQRRQVIRDVITQAMSPESEAEPEAADRHLRHKPSSAVAQRISPMAGPSLSSPMALTPALHQPLSR